MVLDIFRRITGLTIVGAICYITIASGLSIFSWHPILMSIGTILLVTEGILSLSQSKRKHNDAVLIHWGLQIGAGVCIVLGFYSIYAHKTNEHFDHFLTQHANTGLTTIFILFGATIGGSVARYNWIVKKILKPAQMKTIHSIFGLIAYSMLMYTILLGLDTAWFRNQITAQWIQAITYLTWLNMMLVVIKPTISVVKRIQNVLFNGRRQN